MIIFHIVTIASMLLSIQLSESQFTCIPDGGDCVRTCECCGEKNGTICIQRAMDSGPKCFKSKCKQAGHRCLDSSECCSQVCKDGQCMRGDPGSNHWILIDLLTSPGDIKLVLDINLATSSIPPDLSKYNEINSLNNEIKALLEFNNSLKRIRRLSTDDVITTTMRVITVGGVASIIVEPSESGRLKNLVLRTNDGTLGRDGDNDPTSYQIYGQCKPGYPLEEITKERGTHLPADRDFEKWYRVPGNKDYMFYLLVFQNDKGNTMEINFQMKAKKRVLETTA